MKFCPVCQTRYDEEILRFCTKDGAPLVDENPSFRELPSESREMTAEDIGEETLIRRNSRNSGEDAEMPATQPDFAEDSAAPQRIVISTAEELEEEEPPAAVRAKSQPHYEQQTPTQKSNTALIVLTTMFGTLTVLAVLAGAWYVLSSRNAANNNRNLNINTAPPNTNYNINLNGADNSLPGNFNFNANANENTNANANTNANVNANLRSPSPTRTPTPTPTATPDANTITNANVNSNSGGNVSPSPRPTGSPAANSATPTNSPARPSASPTATPANVGIMNSRALSLPKPAYPPAARQMNATGEVRVQVVVDENGIVTSARAISGHTLLRTPAVNAALQSRFNPVKTGDRAIAATGVVVYNFINQ